MYLMPIIVPIYLDGPRRLVATDWKRALILLRDSLGERYGELLVAAPTLPADSAMAGEHKLESIDPGEGIRLEPVMDRSGRARQFWLTGIHRLRARLEGWLPKAQVVHSGLDDLFQPITEVAFLMAHRRGVPTVFVQDTDIILQMRDLAGTNLRKRARAEVYGALFQQVCRASVAIADLALLKGKGLIARYGRHAKNAREFHDTSYLSTEVVEQSVVEARLAGLRAGRSLRLVYCGRLVARKGLADSVRIIELARKRGANVTLEVIGNGPEEAALRQQITCAGLDDAVHLAGSAPYDSKLLKRLAGFDALFFTPTAEDTPRMIFDGYAAGLPLVGVGIPYVQERASEDGAAVVLPRDSVERAAEELVGLASSRQRLIDPTFAALRAAQHHAADVWYRRRAEWTHEAVARHKTLRS